MARGDRFALSDPLTLACHLDERMVRRPHLEVISQTISRITPGGGDRIMIICPPQVGKSVLACWSVLWWLIKHPDARVIIGSYGTSLASERGRTIRRMVETYGHRYGLELMKGAKSVTAWSLTSGGGCRSAGVGAGITGNPADCIAAGTPIMTDSGYVPIEYLASTPNPPRVLAYDHACGAPVFAEIEAARTLHKRDVIEITTRSGRTLRCTPDHRIFAVSEDEADYALAADLAPGHRLLTFDLSGTDTVEHVRRRAPYTSTVYDLQVAEHHNFFAGDILVHNCLVIDDPIRSRADAESRLIREQIWDWWSGDANSRLAPGAPVILLNTRWHMSDLSGRLLAEEGMAHEGGRWQVLFLPAFAVPADSDRGIPPDSLGRSPGMPLPHPRIADGDNARLVQHWEDKRRSATSRDWHALWQGDPRPVEGALVTRALLRERHCYQPTAKPLKHAVAVDPSGEGRDNAGIIGGWLGDDGRLYVSHDATTPSGAKTEKWTHEAVMLAHRIGADKIIYEQTYGKGMVRRVLTVAWQDAQRKGLIPESAFMPRLIPVHAKKSKLLRAEPIAQLFVVDKIRLAAPLPELEEEWTTWSPTDKLSPGRIDAMVYLAYDLCKPRRRRERGAQGRGLNPGAVTRSSLTTAGVVSRTAVAQQAAYDSVRRATG